jgi:hypothetical protein
VALAPASPAQLAQPQSPWLHPPTTASPACLAGALRWIMRLSVPQGTATLRRVRLASMAPIHLAALARVWHVTMGEFCSDADIPTAIGGY